MCKLDVKAAHTLYLALKTLASNLWYTIALLALAAAINSAHTLASTSAWCSTARLVLRRYNAYLIHMYLNKITTIQSYSRGM